MSVRLIKKSSILEVCGSNLLMLRYFKDFFQKLEFASWHMPQDITKQFKSADLITCKKGQRNRIVFNIGRNRYRLICGYWFRKTEVVLYVKFVGTHKEYDTVNVCSVDMFKK